MTIKEMIAVLQAYEEGKEIEFSWKRETNPEWLLADIPTWNFKNKNYRIKPEPPAKKLVPFDFSDAEFLIGKIVKIKNGVGLYLITGASAGYVNVAYSYKLLFEDYTFLDGSPCGKEVEE